jgi:thymidylate synthase ThyX
VETYSSDERQALRPYFTNLDGPVFALVNLPEVVKGALFARYSRSPKSLRRLFLDEFLDEVEAGGARETVGVERAEQLYDKVFLEYGDDSVAQLGGVHLACENVSNILTKILEWGRLMAYLEQSTRYVPYTDRPGGRWKYHVPSELDDSPIREDYLSCLDDAFATYAKWFDSMQDHFGKKYLRREGVSVAVHKRTLRAKALDAVRGLLPAATLANVGIYGTGQAYEALLLRMRANPLREVQACADSMLSELRKVIPAFLRRVDLPDRGGRWSRYLQESRDDVERVVRQALGREVVVEAQPEVVLSDFDPEGEIKVVAAAMYAVTNLPDVELQRKARAMTHEQRLAVLKAYVGDRTNRRHKPGRAFERTSYRFDILGDYGAFRDLQRHRMLTLEWQRLSTDHGYTVAEAIGEAGGANDWTRVMDRSAEVHDALCGAGLPLVASYVVPMAYRVRFYMEMNAREAMHTIELRTTPQGHPSYRRVCQTMHRLIAERAGHRAIAEAIRFADHSEVELERLEAERAAERRREGR